MLQVLHIVYRAMSSPLGQRLLRWFVAIFLVVWAFDTTIFAVTEYAWWVELGLSTALRARWAAQAQVVLLVVLSCLALTACVLPAVLSEAKDANPSLPRALRSLQGLRRAAPGWAWTILVADALWQARRLASYWPDWLRLWSKSQWDFRVPYYGLDVDLWLCRLPFLEQLLAVLWRFSWVLLAVTAIAGLLNALPLLADRHPRTPSRYTATLWRLAAWMLCLRALGYIAHFFTVACNHFDAAELFLQRPLALMGAAFCVALALNCALRRPTERPGASFWKGLGIALLAPFILNLGLAPLVNLLVPAEPILAASQECTRAAWALNAAPATAPKSNVPLEAWTAWDAVHLLQLMNQRNRLDRPPSSGAGPGRVIDWSAQSVDVDTRDGWAVLMVGSPSEGDAFTTSHSVDDSKSLSVARVRLSPVNSTGPTRDYLTPSPLPYYGLEGPTLLGGTDKDSTQAGGVPYGSWFWKFAWIWRLRNIFLLTENRSATRLLVFRGMQERQFRLAPFLTPADDAKPVLSAGRLFWTQALTATTPYFPGSNYGRGGAYYSANAIGHTVQMVMDAATGQVKFFGTQETAPNPASTTLTSWELPLPGLANGGRPAIASPYPVGLLNARADVLSALQGGAPAGPPYFTRTNGRAAPSTVISSPSGWQILTGQAGTLTSWTGPGDLRPRLRALDEVHNQFIQDDEPSSRSQYQEEPGSPAIWPDAAAPGGWWIAKSYFLVPEAGLLAGTDKRTRLFVVAVGGAQGPIGVGSDLRTAWSNLQSKSPKLTIPPSQTGPNPLAAQALDLNHRAVDAFSRGRMAEFGDIMRQQQELLERMAR